MTLELRRRVAFTIGALLVYRLGTYIPVPGIDPWALAQLFQVQSGGLLGGVNLFSGGAVGRLAIFALHLIPYLSAAIIVQLLTLTIPRLKALKRSGEAGRIKIEAYTRYFAIVVAAVQSHGIAAGIEAVPGIVTAPGAWFQISTVLTLVGGAVFLMWLSDQITARGIGNGIALILALGIVTELPSTIAGTLELGRQGLLSANAMLGVLVVAVALTAVIVVMELAQRRLPLEFPARQIGARTIAGRSHLGLKLNSGGVMSAIFASYLMLVPIMIANFGAASGWSSAVVRQFSHGGAVYLTLHVLFIVVCAFVYTAFLLNPDTAAEDLSKYGGAITGVEPGEATAAHIDHVLSRITLLGAAYLALVYLVPELLITYAQVPFYLGGASLLIVVCTVLDLQKEAQGYATIKSGADVR